MKRGEIYEYDYLWLHEQKKGRKKGVKDRPTCLMIVSKKDPPVLYLYPITGSKPEAGASAIQIPADERKLAGLTKESWIVLSEMNSTSTTDEFKSAQPIGAFSAPFLAKVSGAAIKYIKSAKRIDRDDKPDRQAPQTTKPKKTV